MKDAIVADIKTDARELKKSIETAKYTSKVMIEKIIQVARTQSPKDHYKQVPTLEQQWSQ